MQRVNARIDQAEDEAVATAARDGDESAFADLAERYRPELQVHCYRMLGSLEDSEDLVHDTFLRAWRERDTYAAGSAFRTWLYQIATRACLDFLDRRPHDRQVAPAGPDGTTRPAAVISWLQPYPDRLLDSVGAGAYGPGEDGVGKETIGLAFVAAIQHLPPRQRAVLILRDVLRWPAKEAAAALATSVASVNSALQRARSTLQRHLPARRLDWTPPEEPGESERTALERYMAAIERADDGALARLLSARAQAGQQAGAGGYEGPEPAFVEGREEIIAAWAPALHGPDALEFRFMATYANRQPTAASYVRAPEWTEFRPFALSVLRLEDGAVTDVSTFPPALFPVFALPVTV